MKPRIFALGIAFLFQAPHVLAQQVDPEASVTCDLNGIRQNMGSLSDAYPVNQAQVLVTRTDANAGNGAASYRANDTIAAFDVSLRRSATSLVAPNDFTFRSGWFTNTQFAFRRGQTLPIDAAYINQAGEQFYAIRQANDGHLIIFAKTDGSLCNKVMNTQMDLAAFMAGRYATKPATRMLLDDGQQQGGSGHFKYVLLGVDGGLIRIREIQSAGAKVIHSEDYRFDSDAKELDLGDVKLHVLSVADGVMTASVTFTSTTTSRIR